MTARPSRAAGVCVLSAVNCSEDLILQSAWCPKPWLILGSVYNAHVLSLPISVTLRPANASRVPDLTEKLEGAKGQYMPILSNTHS